MPEGVGGTVDDGKMEGDMEGIKVFMESVVKERVGLLN